MPKKNRHSYQAGNFLYSMSGLPVVQRGAKNQAI